MTRHVRLWVIYWRSSPTARWRLGQALGAGTTEEQARAQAEQVRHDLRARYGHPRAEARASNAIL